VSPLSLRRYRAERLLREDFERLRAHVLGNVRARLRWSGLCLDASDLDACYAQAWQGLYAAVLGGERIANPGGWLSVVTTRRAIDEHRARERARCRAGGAGDSHETAVPVSSRARLERERDIAAELDDRARLRQLFEGLRGRLSSRELQAAALCYLQGLSRSEAAAQMGLSQRRMRKLMEGTAERPGVAGKVGTLADTIRAGAWCDEQGSLMRAFAYGILDPVGERHQLALIHSSECPACRAYVLSLRGLAAALPPVPMLLRWALPACAGGGAGAGVGVHTATSGGSPVAAGAATGSGLAPSAPGLAGALSASGAGASAAGGGWLLAGAPLGAKLAAGCALALGLGAGCAVLAQHHPAHAPAARRQAARGDAGARGASGAGVASVPGVPAQAPGSRPAPARGPVGAATGTSGGPAAPGRAVGSPPAGRHPGGNAVREFGPEQQLAGAGPARGPGQGAGVEPARAVARAASAPEAQITVGNPPAGGSPAAPHSSSSAPAAAEREFAPG
jgi:DNA-directed RNA polymerase specialized sigma24 family protein